MEKQDFKSIRVKPGTVTMLADIQLAFETCYMQRFTKDDILRKLFNCVEEAEPAVWESYCLIQSKKEESGS